MKKAIIGFQLVKESIRYARTVKGFYFFPLMSSICILVSIIGFGAISYYYAGRDLNLLCESIMQHEGISLHIVNVFLFTFVSLFLSIFFNVALLGALRSHIENNTSSFSQGIAFAFSKIKPIFFWTCVSYFIGNAIAYIFKPLTERFPAASTILQSLVGAAWGVATYFVLPVMVFESHSKVKSIIKESAHLMKEKLPEQISARFYIGTFYLVAALTLSMIFIGSLYFVYHSFATYADISVLPSIVFAIFSFFLLVFGMIFLTLLTTVTQTVVNFSLYHYAKNGIFPKHFKASNMVLGKI